jgi:cell division protein FtsI (penicillin-binding protein 3)
MNTKNIKYSRLSFIFIVIILIFIFIIFKMITLVLNQDKKINHLYNNNKLNSRADIYDRNGILVATDLKTKSLYLNSNLARNSQFIAKTLPIIFNDISEKELLKKIVENNKQQILIKRNLTPSQVEKVKKLEIAGLIFEEDLIRIYPQKSIVSHYVGYTDSDRNGLAGIEMQYNKQLLNNKPVYLSLDIRVQDILHNELIKAKEQFKAKNVGGLILNVNTGEILALSSLPSFDPNLQSEANPEQRFNMITGGVYELGSVMKLFTNALALEKKLINLKTTFSVKEPIKYGRFTIKDHDFHQEILDVNQIFAYSSNIGTIKIAEKFGPKAQQEFFTKLGFLNKITADFPGLGRPLYPKHWRDINMFTISYGHGLATTPLHFAIAASAMINGGNLLSPIFIKNQYKLNESKVISQETTENLKKMLRNVVENGTGKFANVDGYEVGGKTGTADRAENGSYNEKQTLASFVGIFPISKPQYLVYILFDRPNNIYNTAGMIAAPIAGKIIKNIAPILEVMPISNNKSNDKKHE